MELSDNLRWIGLGIVIGFCAGFAVATLWHF